VHASTQQQYIFTQGCAASLFDLLAVVVGNYSAGLVKQQVWDGLLDIMEAVQWNSIYMPESGLVMLLREGVVEGHVGGTIVAATSIFNKFIKKILQSFGACILNDRATACIVVLLNILFLVLTCWCMFS
jgi:hypothetical protein